MMSLPLKTHGRPCSWMGEGIEIPLERNTESIGAGKRQCSNRVTGGTHGSSPSFTCTSIPFAFLILSTRPAGSVAKAPIGRHPVTNTSEKRSPVAACLAPTSGARSAFTCLSRSSSSCLRVSAAVGRWEREREMSRREGAEEDEGTGGAGAEEDEGSRNVMSVVFVLSAAALRRALTASSCWRRRNLRGT
jgi:hypothetical protein